MSPIDAETQSGYPSWVPHHQRMVIAGKHVRLTVFQYPYWKGGRRRRSLFKKLGRASKSLSEEEREANRLKNAKRRETKVKDLARCNIEVWKKGTDGISCNKFVTLTIREDVKDIATGNKLLKGFRERLARKLQKKCPGFRLKAIWVAEFQDESRGVVHYHLLCNIPYIEQKSVITRSKIGGDSRVYEYLQKDGSWSPVANRETRSFESFREAKVFVRSLGSCCVFGFSFRVRKILFELAISWEKGFVDVEVITCSKRAREYTGKLCSYLAKAGNDERFWGKRIFDYTRGNLAKPVVIDEDEYVDRFIEENELWLCQVSEFYFECYLGTTEMYIFDLWLLDDISFGHPPNPPPQLNLKF
jgi:hypothetical protein